MSPGSKPCTGNGSVRMTLSCSLITGMNTSQGISADQPRPFAALVDDPNASDGGVLTGGAGKRSFNHILRAMDSLHDFANIIGRGVADQSMREGGKIRDGKSRSMEKLCLTRSFRKVKSEEAAGKLEVFYNGVLYVRQAHDAFILCCLLHWVIFERTGRSPARVCSRRVCRL